METAYFSETVIRTYKSTQRSVTTLMTNIDMQRNDLQY
jgi:hypothetical protein